MSLTVVTYGGGEILKNIFNALAMLMNSKSGGFIQPLMIISISIGTVFAASKAFFSSSAQAFLGQFVIPLIGIVGILMVPTSSVHIEDILRSNSYKVDNVPFLVAKFAELSSSFGYYVTKAVEKTMHVPQDVSYNTTGMLFGADSAMEISRYKIANADLEKNLRSFCRQCVLYDLHLGRYSIDDLKKSTDLWKFFEQKTSKVRMMKYTPMGSKDEGKKHNLSEYVTCKDAIKKMTPFFETEKRYFGQLDVCKNLGLTFQALTGLQKNAEELVSQQLTMNLLADEFNANNFAKARAYTQQRNTYQVLGSLASSSLVTLRAVLEALIYASFIFILPLSVLPGGIKFITTWMGLVLWIQLWPPFYAILNYIMQSVAHGYSDTIFFGLSGAQQGLSLFTSIGLHNLQQDIYALSGFLAASIPFITYAILKGGVSSFVHLAGSMMSPAQSAASSAAIEQTSGNYSFANTSYGQTSYKNTTGFQTNLAPSLSGGFFHENTGVSSATYAHTEQILRQSNSELRSSFFSDESISQSLQTSKMHALSAVETSQKAYSENLSAHARNIADLSSHVSNSENYSTGVSERAVYDLQESGRYFQNTAENFGQQFGLSSRASMELLIGMGIDKGIVAKGTTGLGGGKEEAMNSALNIVKSEEFQKHFQHLEDVSKSEAYTSLSDVGKRLSESASQSFEKMQTSQSSFQNAQSDLNQVSENISWAEQNSQLIRHSRNQDFINWASAIYSDEGGFSRVQSILESGNSNERAILLDEFVKYLKTTSSQMNTPQNFVDPQVAFAHSHPKEMTTNEGQNAVHQFLSESSFASQVPYKKEELEQKFVRSEEEHIDHFNKISSKVEAERQDAMQHFHGESERSLYTRPLDLASNEIISSFDKLTPFLAKLKIPTTALHKSTIANGFQIKEEPFWMQSEEIR